MNVKKYLKKKAQEDLASVQTDRDREVLQRLQNSVVEEPPPKKRNLKWLWAIPSGAVALAVAAVLIVELVPSPGNDVGGLLPPPGGNKYEDANLVQEISDITELSNALTNLTLHFTDEQTITVAKFSDSLSGDELYYVLSIDVSSMEAVYRMRFLIVVNDNYDYDKFTMEGDILTATYTDYSVTYQQQIAPDPDFGVNMIECSAKIDSAKYEMYVLVYQEYALENGMFLTVINNLLEFHD